LSRHGQSEYNAVGRIGGDSGLSQHGLNYAHKLAEFTDNFICKNPDGTEKAARLWTSTMRRTKETAQFILSKPFRRIDQDDPSLEHEWVQMRPRAWHHIDELFAGSCDGMTYEEIEEQFPEEFERRKTDKLAYRYPRGESYLDVIARLEPIIIEMERHREPLLIVSHQGILRIIYAFYMGLTRAEAPYVSIPLNTVTQLSPSAFNCDIQKHVLYKIELAADGQDEPLAVRMERQAAITDPASH
jgi:broad specificity phosphatase PhoE